MSNIVVIGKPGAGKGTLVSAALEGRSEQVVVFSTGNLLRAARKSGTELGLKAAPYMDAGSLVPDDIIVGITLEAINATDKTVVLDGFPRTVPQAQAMLDAGLVPDKVIEVYLDNEIVKQRAADRVVCDSCGESYTLGSFNPTTVAGICDKCSGNVVRRKDDAPETVDKRLTVYQEQTYPVIDILKNAGITVITVDNSLETAFTDFTNALLG